MENLNFKLKVWAAFFGFALLALFVIVSKCEENRAYRLARNAEQTAIKNAVTLDVALDGFIFSVEPKDSLQGITKSHFLSFSVVTIENDTVNIFSDVPGYSQNPLESLEASLYNRLVTSWSNSGFLTYEVSFLRTPEGRNRILGFWCKETLGTDQEIRFGAIPKEVLMGR